jgi:very-short-patch-repair endonuclease
LLKGAGCSCCQGFSVVENINSIYKTDKWLIPIINDDVFCKTHTHSNGEKVFPTCPDCGRKNKNYIKVNNLYNRHGFACPKCGDGIKYPNKFAFNILEQLKIEFETEYSPKWCKYEFREKLRQGRYDFYFELNNKEYILEMDGGFHNKDNAMSGGQTADESKYIDNEKDRLANEHGIEIIRIDCNYSSIETRFEYIKQNILNNNKLNGIFNLGNVNWNKCHEYGLSNLVKEACKYKIENLSTIDIAKIMKHNNTTINGWIKEGSQLGWC